MFNTFIKMRSELISQIARDLDDDYEDVLDFIHVVQDPNGDITERRRAEELAVFVLECGSYLLHFFGPAKYLFECGSQMKVEKMRNNMLPAGNRVGGRIADLSPV
jgi:hypothetical protein